MSNLQSQTFTIPNGSKSVKVRINLTGTNTIASIATSNNITPDSEGNLFVKVKTD